MDLCKGENLLCCPESVPQILLVVAPLGIPMVIRSAVSAHCPWLPETAGWDTTKLSKSSLEYNTMMKKH